VLPKKVIQEYDAIKPGGKKKKKKKYWTKNSVFHLVHFRPRTTLVAKEHSQENKEEIGRGKVSGYCMEFQVLKKGTIIFSSMF